MPELLEIEYYRQAAVALVGGTVASVHAPDSWYMKNTDRELLTSVLVQRQVDGVRRIGKLLLLDTDGPTIGLRFGMTGRLVVNGSPVIAQLEYSSATLNDEWTRFAVEFDDARSLAINDPRRLGGVTLDPDESALGIDAWSASRADVHRVTRSRAAIKAVLLNQKRIAGLGNLLVDEILWRSDIDPRRTASSLPDEAEAQLARCIPVVLSELFERGGSNCGDLFVERNAEGRCPRDGAALAHDTVGGRSTWWCPDHQH